MVTRELEADRRYGLGKSLTPVIEVLSSRGVTVDYLCQADVGARSRRWLQATYKRLGRLLTQRFPDTDTTSLAWGLLERLNMGRLAAKVAARGRYTHVHCHDAFIAAGDRWLTRLRYGTKPRWGVTSHGFGSYAQAFHEDGAVLGTKAMRWLSCSFI